MYSAPTCFSKSHRLPLLIRCVSCQAGRHYTKQHTTHKGSERTEKKKKPTQRTSRATVRDFMFPTKRTQFSSGHHISISRSQLSVVDSGQITSTGLRGRSRVVVDSPVDSPVIVVVDFSGVACVRISNANTSTPSIVQKPTGNYMHYKPSCTPTYRQDKTFALKAKLKAGVLRVRDFLSFPRAPTTVREKTQSQTSKLETSIKQAKQKKYQKRKQKTRATNR